MAGFNALLESEKKVNTKFNYPSIMALPPILLKLPVDVAKPGDARFDLVANVTVITVS